MTERKQEGSGAYRYFTRMVYTVRPSLVSSLGLTFVLTFALTFVLTFVLTLFSLSVMKIPLRPQLHGDPLLSKADDCLPYCLCDLNPIFVTWNFCSSLPPNPFFSCIGDKRLETHTYKYTDR